VTKANTNVSQPCPKEQGFNKMGTKYIIFVVIPFYPFAYLININQFKALAYKYSEELLFLRIHTNRRKIMFLNVFCLTKIT